QQQGATVQLFSLLSSPPGPVHPTSKKLAKQVHYALQVYDPRLWLAQLYFMVKAPRRYCKLLWNLMKQPVPQFSWLFKRLLIFWKGVYLAKYLQGSGVQLIHAHFAWLSAAAALVVSQLLDLPLTVTAHACDIYSPENDLLCLIAGASDRLVPISDYNKRIIGELCPRAVEDRMEVIHCGIDLDRFQTTSTMSDTTLRILSVGSLVEKKGHEYLIRACQRLKDQGLDFHCTIIGRGGRRAALERLIADLGVKDVVTLAGAREQGWVYEALQNSHIFALACVVAENGDRDGIPVAMMEALAMGVPVVSTRVSGIPELVRHQETGLLTPEKDVEAFAAAMIQLAEDDALRQRLAANGRSLVEQEFNIQENGRRSVDLFRQVIQERK
ncbi:MAG: colanic acid biosynthesis glycosyltransferase WcaL, partial [Chloroflexi bacterium]|nr:colanic acid biosynthesis glycosyltransferase WcaL [Chloroflexota bacterium]